MVAGLYPNMFDGHCVGMMTDTVLGGLVTNLALLMIAMDVNELRSFEAPFGHTKVRILFLPFECSWNKLSILF